MTGDKVISRAFLVSVTIGLMVASGHVFGQQGQETDETPASAQASAPVDLTGTWVSIVTEDWRWRMVTPARGDYASVPITEEGRLVADAWDPVQDEALGQACRSYGGAAIMRVPGRVRIDWQDEKTLRVEADAGTQTRVFHFGAQAQDLAPGEPSWQGHSVAEWETEDGEPDSDMTGSLKLVTTNMLPGYLRKNGVPYSADAVLTEYWDLNTAPNGDPWLVITTVVEDAQYLQKPYGDEPKLQERGQ